MHGTLFPFECDVRDSLYAWYAKTAEGLLAVIILHARSSAIQTYTEKYHADESFCAND